MIQLATFKQYSLNDGTKRWMVTGYLGVDYITGKQNNYKRRGFETKRAAQYAFNQAKLDFENGVKQTKSKTTFKEVYDLWFPVYKTTVRESTWITTKSRIEKYIIPEFGDILFERIDVKTAQKAVNDWAKKFGMYTKLLSYVKRIGDHAVAMSIIPINPFRQITNPAQLTKKVNDKKDRRNPKKKNLKFYSKKQLNAFLNYCEVKLSEIPESRKVQYYYAQLDYALFQLMAYSGARIGEILALTWSDIDFIDQTLNIDKTLSKTTTGYVIEDPKK